MDGPIVEVGLAVAKDFVDRPSYFTGVSDKIAEVLANLWYRTGTDPRFPDRQKRATVFGAIFGACDCGKADERVYSEQFQLARDAVLDAAVRYTKRTFDDGRDSLFRAFRDRLVTLREYLTTFDGSSLRTTDGQTTSIFDDCVQILKDENVARSYARRPAPNKDAWPINGEYSGDGAHIIETITEVTNPPLTGTISRYQVTVAQRIAFDGGRTVSAAVDSSVNLDDKDKVNELIQIAFTWWTALQDARSAGGETLAGAQSETRPVPDSNIARTFRGGRA
jgi:hypothetical protein